MNKYSQNILKLYLISSASYSLFIIIAGYFGRALGLFSPYSFSGPMFFLDVAVGVLITLWTIVNTAIFFYSLIRVEKIVFVISGLHVFQMIFSMKLNYLYVTHSPFSIFQTVIYIYGPNIMMGAKTIPETLNIIFHLLPFLVLTITTAALVKLVFGKRKELPI